MVVLLASPRFFGYFSYLLWGECYKFQVQNFQASPLNHVKALGVFYILDMSDIQMSHLCLIDWIVNRLRKSIICVRILKVFTFKKAFKNIKNSDFGLISDTIRNPNH